VWASLGEGRDKDLGDSDVRGRKRNLASIWPIPLQLNWKAELGDTGERN